MGLQTCGNTLLDIVDVRIAAKVKRADQISLLGAEIEVVYILDERI